jgi:glyoxylate reductase
MSEPKRLFVTRRLSIDPSEAVGSGIEVDVFGLDRAPTRDELLAGAAEADALVTLLSDRVDAALLDALPWLRVVSNHAVGVDNVDVAAATERGVWVTNTPDVLTHATAELTWALILAVARRLREGDRMLRAGAFGGWSPTMLLGQGLRGRSLGIFGFGRIGQAVAAAALGFGMDVLACSRSPLPAAWSPDAGRPPAPREPRGASVIRVEKEELLERSDVITIHCPLSEATRHAFGERELGAMRAGAILINTSRGPVVDEAALVAALESGRLGGAGLDVFEREPLVHPGLVGRDDVVLLPHVGSATHEARRGMATLALCDAARVLRGEPPLHPVNVLPPGTARRPRPPRA